MIFHAIEPKLFLLLKSLLMSKSSFGKRAKEQLRTPWIVRKVPMVVPDQLLWRAGYSPDTPSLEEIRKEDNERGRKRRKQTKKAGAQWESRTTPFHQLAFSQKLNLFSQLARGQKLSFYNLNLPRNFLRLHKTHLSNCLRHRKLYFKLSPS